MTTFINQNFNQQPRQRATGPNFQDATMVTFNTTATSAGVQGGSLSTSEAYSLFQLPDPCIVVRGHISGSLPASGVTGQVVLKLGTSKGDQTFGLFTVSGGGTLPKTPIYGPFTLSSSGGAFSASNPQFWPVTVTVFNGLISASSTTSLSLYVLLESVQPGNIGGTGTQGL